MYGGAILQRCPLLPSLPARSGDRCWSHRGRACGTKTRLVTRSHDTHEVIVLINKCFAVNGLLLIHST